jgi:hypothetical protein
LELVGHDLAVGRQRIGLPVVEVELGGRSHLALGARGVAHVRQADGDLVSAAGLDLRLRDAKLVDAAAHDVDRPLQRRGGYVRALGARQALVNKLYAALEVEAEHGLLCLDRARDAGDHDQRAEEQPDDQEQDEAIALAISHPS